MIHPDIAARVDQIEEDFHRLWYEDFEHTWETTTWRGIKVLKCPTDLWAYQEVVWECMPDVIVECGTAHGGSALFFADMLALLPQRDGVPRRSVLTIDIAPPSQFPHRARHPDIRYLNGSSVSPGIVTQVRAEIRSYVDREPRVMVVLDSDHRRDHVLAELDTYAPLVTPGQYLVVEDTNVNGRPVVPEHGPGPGEALDTWLPGHREFEVDHARERHLSFNRGGWLRRTA